LHKLSDTKFYCAPCVAIYIQARLPPVINEKYNQSGVVFFICRLLKCNDKRKVVLRFA